jgi:hypothetical protein
MGARESVEEEAVREAGAVEFWRGSGTPAVSASSGGGEEWGLGRGGKADAASPVARHVAASAIRMGRWRWWGGGRVGLAFFPLYTVVGVMQAADGPA